MTKSTVCRFSRTFIETKIRQCAAEARRLESLPDLLGALGSPCAHSLIHRANEQAWRTMLRTHWCPLPSEPTVRRIALSFLVVLSLIGASYLLCPVTAVLAWYTFQTTVAVDGPGPIAHCNGGLSRRIP